MLRQHGAYWHCPVMNGMGAPALDFHVCHRGRYAGIETKAPGNKPTPRQLRTKRDIELAGGVVFIISDGEGLKELDAWLSITRSTP